MSFKLTFIRMVLNFIRFREHRIFNSYRIMLLKMLGAKIGKKVFISTGVIIDYPENLFIGSNVSIQHNCFISAYAPVIIDDNVSIGHGTSIVTTTHPYNEGGNIRESKLISGAVHIKKNCWIGMKASILFGVTIDEGVVVGAHALVNKSISANLVVGGVPAKTLKPRFN